MKTTQKKLTKKTAYVVGTQLPDKLPKKASDFLSCAVTPRRAFDVAAKVARIAAKNSTAIKVKRAC